MITIGVVLAAVITVTFELVTPGNAFDTTVDGLRFSSPCWFKINQQLMVDRANNCDHPVNPGFSYPGDVALESGGLPFDFLGLDTYAPLSPMGVVILSSRGGIYSSPTAELSTRFDLDWPGVTWVSVVEWTDGFHQRHGYDNIRYSFEIDEPTTAVLVGIAGLIGFIFCRRRGIA
jgi:hypothetical protein